MQKLAPSILSADFNNLGSEVKAVEEAGAHYIHIDVMDGVFVDNISFGIPIVKGLRSITDIIFDVHLMTVDPMKHFEPFARAGADIINFHFEAVKNPAEAVKKIRDLNKKAAITISPETKGEQIFKYLHLVDMVLIMSVNPGYGGQEFIPGSLKKAELIADFIQKESLNTDIEMDGGITVDNVRTVINSGVNTVVVGSAIFGSADIYTAVREFYNIFEGA